jgi:hypothetical protein
MSDISWHLGFLETALIALVLCSPGILAGLCLGACAWREHRVRGAIIGAIAGLAVAAIFILICINSRIATDGDGLVGTLFLTLRAGWPGLIAGSLIALFAIPSHRIVGPLTGAALGFIVWLGGWAAFF